MSKSLITSPSPQTFVEACDVLRDLQRQVKGTLGDIKQKGKDLIVYRYQQGKVASIALGMDRSETYGGKVIETLAKRADIHERTLYRALQFYKQIGGGETSLRKWMDDVEEEKGEITWSYCVNWTEKALPEAEKDAGEKLEKVVQKLEKKAEKIEHEAADVEREVQKWNDDGKREEALGVVEKAREIAADVRAQAERLELQKPERITDEKYLEYVRTFNCLCCENAAEPHHLLTGGMGTKGPDWVVIPLCRIHHQEFHQIGHGPFSLKYDTDLWRAVANLLVIYFTGVQIDRQ